MNKRGQTYIVGLMIGVIFFFFGMVIAHPLSQVISSASTDMNCTTVTAYQDKANCVIVDIFLPVFVGAIFGFAGFIIGGKL